MRKATEKLDLLLREINEEYIEAFNKFNEFAGKNLDTPELQSQMNDILIRIQDIYWQELAYFNKFITERYDFAQKSTNHFNQFIEDIKKNEAVSMVDRN